MRKHKKTRANSGETLVEVTASIFIFLIMLGIIQGAISYSQASLAKNKEIRSENAKIIEGLQSAATQEEMVKNMQFVATNSDGKRKSGLYHQYLTGQQDRYLYGQQRRDEKYVLLYVRSSG